MGWVLPESSGAALTGGASLLGLYAGKGTRDQEEERRLRFMIEDLVKWFKAEYGSNMVAFAAKKFWLETARIWPSDAQPWSRASPKDKRIAGRE